MNSLLEGARAMAVPLAIAAALRSLLRRTYSLNEARYEDWPKELQRYVTDMKLGKNQIQKPYDLVYVCSLVADAHWVLIRGGMACNPRSHLRLCYEGNPMGLVRSLGRGLWLIVIVAFESLQVVVVFRCALFTFTCPPLIHVSLGEGRTTP